MRTFFKSLAVLIILSLVGIKSIAQVVTFTPSFATDTDSVIIIFDATLGNGELAGFTGDVYLWTGPVTNQSAPNWASSRPSSGWDSSFPEELRATPLGDDKWEFTYGPSVREFFNISSPIVVVERIGVLFRGVENGSLSAVGRGVRGEDIFIDLVQPGDFTATFLNPGTDVTFVNEGDSIEVVGLAGGLTGNIDYELSLNGNVIYSSSEDTLKFKVGIGAEFQYDLLLTATHESGATATAEASLIKLNSSNQQSRPAGTKDGITYLSATEARLSLFAPYHENVFVIGDFNNWEIRAEYQMNKDSLNPDSTWYWIDVSGLTPGTEVGFQYLVDGNIRIHDPYSPIVLDPFNDQFIPASSYPNLKPYPEGKSSGIVGVMFPGAEAYDWEVTDFQKPDRESLVVYELLLRDFLQEKNYTTLIDTLDYLEHLGINAIELMPVSEFDGNLSWGYNPYNHIALDKFYGSPNEFKRFVDECHKRGIAVILDVVMNHASDQNSFYQLYPISQNPYFNEVPTHSFNVFNDFNHQYSGTQYYNKRMIEWWINEYKVDGFRWDLTKGFTQNCASGFDCTQSFNQDRVDVLKKYADYQWAADPDFYVIFEHLGSGGSFTEEVEWAKYRLNEGKGIMLWGKANPEYNEATMGYHSNGQSDFGNVLAPASFNARSRVGYMESHDEQWLMFKNISFGNSSGDYNVRELETALDRMEMAGTFFFLLPGPKMIWQFGELGYGYGDNGEQCLKPGGDGNGDCAASAPSRTGEKPIRWDYYFEKGRKDLYEHWSNLLELRWLSPAFTDPDAESYDFRYSVKSYSLQHSDTDVFAIGNFSVTTQTETKNLPQSGTWFNYFTGEELNFESTSVEFTLDPGDFLLLTTKQFALPTSSGDERIAEEPIEFRLMQNYPNPFNPTTTLDFQLSQASEVKLIVYDILGREVATLVDGPLTRGSHSVNFDAANLGSGIYIARLVSGNNVSYTKMTLIK